MLQKVHFAAICCNNVPHRNFSEGSSVSCNKHMNAYKLYEFCKLAFAYFSFYYSSMVSPIFSFGSSYDSVYFQLSQTSLQYCYHFRFIFSKPTYRQLLQDRHRPTENCYSSLSYRLTGFALAKMSTQPLVHTGFLPELIGVSNRHRQQWDGHVNTKRNNYNIIINSITRTQTLKKQTAPHYVVSSNMPWQTVWNI